MSQSVEIHLSFEIYDSTQTFSLTYFVHIRSILNCQITAFPRLVQDQKN